MTSQQPSLLRGWLLSFVIMCAACEKNHQEYSLQAVLSELAESEGITSEPALALALRQGWRATPEAGFSPGLVRLYCGVDGFVVHAALSDDQIENTADGFNQNTWETGDVFECFIQTRSGHYYEVHVTPENQNLFLEWTPELFQAVKNKQSDITVALIEDTDFAKSDTLVSQAQNYWTVSLRIPYNKLGLSPGQVRENPGTAIKLSFGRYDTTRGKVEPVLSATSDMPEPNFHLCENWHPL